MAPLYLIASSIERKRLYFVRVGDFTQLYEKFRTGPEVLFLLSYSLKKRNLITIILKSLKNRHIASAKLKQAERC